MGSLFMTKIKKKAKRRSKINNMKILCPACSEEKPLVINITRRDVSALCSKCARRYKVETFVLEKYQNERSPVGFRYFLHCREEEKSKKISLLLKQQIPLQSGDTYTLVSRNGIPLGLANQRQNTWNTLFYVNRSSTFLNGLALFLAFPLVILTLLQATRIPGYLLEQSPETWLIAAAIIFPLFFAPGVFWILKETFTGDDRSRHIPGYHAEDDDL
jgi:hypothetical protein